MAENETDILACAGKNEAYDTARFALVTYVGTPIAILGIFFNGLLIKLFSSRKRLQSPTLYLFMLAIFDTLICIIYIPFFTVDALAIYYQNTELHHLWHSYSMFLYGLSRIVQFASTYMVVCATIERFIVVANFKALRFISTAKGRIGTIIIAVIIILALRIPAFFDYTITYDPRCGSFEDYMFEPVLMNHEDYVMFNFYVISVVQILVPFILLLSLNLLIILLTKRKMYSTLGARHTIEREMPKIAKLLRKESIMNNKQHRLELRYATRTMVMIVFTYLVCNVFNVFITIMENVFKDNPLMFNEDGSSTKFYTYTADIISIMVALNSLSRIFVYFFGNPQFRIQLISVAQTTFSKFRDCITITHFSKKLDECKPFDVEKSNSLSKTDDTCYL